MIKSYRPVEVHREAVYWDTHREVDREVDQDSTEAAYRERNHEVDRMVTEADFERRLPSQCHLPMFTDWEIFYAALHASSGERKFTFNC